MPRSPSLKRADDCVHLGSLSTFEPQIWTQESGEKHSIKKLLQVVALNPYIAEHHRRDVGLGLRQSSLARSRRPGRIGMDPLTEGCRFVPLPHQRAGLDPRLLDLKSLQPSRNNPRAITSSRDASPHFRDKQAPRAMPATGELGLECGPAVNGSLRVGSTNMKT